MAYTDSYVVIPSLVWTVVYFPSVSVVKRAKARSRLRAAAACVWALRHSLHCAVASYARWWCKEKYVEYFCASLSKARARLCVCVCCVALRHSPLPCESPPLPSVGWALSLDVRSTQRLVEDVRRGCWSLRTRAWSRWRSGIRSLQPPKVQWENRLTHSAPGRRDRSLPGGHDGHHFHQGKSNSSSRASQYEPHSRGLLYKHGVKTH